MSILMIILILLAVKCVLDASYWSPSSPAFWLNLAIGAAFVAVLITRVA